MSPSCGILWLCIGIVLQAVNAGLVGWLVGWLVWLLVGLYIFEMGVGYIRLGRYGEGLYCLVAENMLRHPKRWVEPDVASANHC